MRKSIFKTGTILLMCFAACICATGCEEEFENFAEENAVTINDDDTAFLNKTDREQVGTNDETVYIWTDPETGVQYIVYREKFMNAGFGGITPRLNSDGTICVVSPEEETTDLS